MKPPSIPVPCLSFVSVGVYIYKVTQLDLGVGGRSNMWILGPFTVWVVGDSEVMLFNYYIMVSDLDLGIGELIML